MNQKRSSAVTDRMIEYLYGLALFVALISLLAVVYKGIVDAINPPPKPIDVVSEVVVMDVWVYESSPLDRKVILKRLSALECVEAGLCQLTVSLPVAE